MFLGAFEMSLKILGRLFELSGLNEIEDDQMFLALPLVALAVSHRLV